MQAALSPAPVLSVRDLGIAFGDVAVAEGVSFDLRRGETVGLVGESGCGKSVTALALTGLMPAPGRIVSGEVLFRGQDLATLPESQLRDFRGNGIAMVFQEPMTALNPVYTVGDQVAEGYALHHGCTRTEAWDEAVAMLAKVGIPEPAARAKAYPHQLSGGMRQRAMIAMALVCRPAVLVADEPTTALDVTVQAQILDLMLAMQGELDTAVLFISHDLGVVSEVADRVLVMYAGRVVESAPADALFESPRHPYTRGLIETLPANAHPGERLAAIPGTVPDPRDPPPGCRFAPRCALADERCRREDQALSTAVHGVACWKASP